MSNQSNDRWKVTIWIWAADFVLMLLVCAGKLDYFASATPAPSICMHLDSKMSQNYLDKGGLLFLILTGFAALSFRRSYPSVCDLCNTALFIETVFLFGWWTAH